MDWILGLKTLHDPSVAVGMAVVYGFITICTAGGAAATGAVIHVIRHHEGA